jgi:HK97 family phage major capsid protein
LKKEEFFAISRRTTNPTTVYKKQKLDRDDIIDITDFDVVAWLKAEMRVMLDEEVARAALVSDGREPEDPDKISESNIRPIAKEDNFYAHVYQVPANTSGGTLVEEILRSRTNYKGSGNPSFYTTEAILTDLLLVKDKVGRRYHQTVADVAAALRVSEIIPVEVMEGITDNNGAFLIGILVNMKDYTFGADKGGAVSMFDDFDIDYNQFKYLIETRCSGALVLPKSAIVFWRATGTLAVPTPATFVQGTNTITIPTSAGVSYFVDGVDTPAGAVVITEDAVVEAVADTGYYFAPNQTVEWTFTYVEPQQ